MEEPTVVQIPKIRVKCGLAWPEKGNPAYYCIVGELIEDKTQSFDPAKPPLQIIQEGAASTFSGLTTALSSIPHHHLSTIYTSVDPKFANFIKDFSRWKRQASIDSRLVGTKAASFEASMLKIRELVQEKRLVFPLVSHIRAQLASFARANLTDEVDFYAVRALSYVVWAFDRPKGDGTAEIVPKLKAWW
jgi:hypothetical protein